MREEDLRQVLLVKAIEESDTQGVLVSPADRVAASRGAKRNAGDSASSPDALLSTRAQLLLPRISARHAVVGSVLALVGGGAWVRWLLVVLALFIGFGLSALDGTRHIDILSFPLLGLVLWNLAAYAVLAVAALSKAHTNKTRRRWLSATLAYRSVARVSRTIARSRAFDVTLSEALGRFVSQWYETVKPLLVQRARRVLHLSAAAVGIGLIIGLYLRGIALDYRAGWDSTFLDAHEVHTLLSIVYQAALALTGIGLPDPPQLEAIRWRNGGGENAARWIHLLAATVAIFVVMPRLVMALAATGAVWRLSRRATVPPDLERYYRRVFADGEPSVAAVVPYAYEPTPNALARLRNLLAEEHGGRIKLDVQPLARYGEEDDFLAGLKARVSVLPETLVVLTTLAATPEDENHGSLIAELRDWLAAASPQTHLVVVVDEGPYARRMSADGGTSTRVDERRELWRDFISARGVRACVADLSP